MAHTISKTVKPAQRGRILLSCRVLPALLSCCLLSGCVTLPAWFSKHDELVPTGPVTQMAMAWDNQVRFVPDPTKEGRPGPCLTGRLYLFSRRNPHPVVAAGDVVVRLYRLDVMGPDGQPKLVEVWNIPADKLQLMRHKDDFVGWGYTLALPWATYHPSVVNVELSVSFQPPGGYPMYSRSKQRLEHQPRTFNSQQTVQPMKMPPTGRQAK